jgi:hypothetical protein
MSKERLKTPCILCKNDSKNEEDYGEVFQNKNWTVHHFCLVKKIKMSRNFKKIIFFYFLVVFK